MSHGGTNNRRKGRPWLLLSFAAVLALPGCAPKPGTYAPGGIAISPADTPEQLTEKAASVVPSGRQLAWQALEFQAFVHFGMNTFTDCEWGRGAEDPALFDPTDFDASQWVEAVQAAGIRGLIVTAKHHDGFCLWPSRFTEHSVKNSPWRGGRGDVVREVADACRKGGLKFGLYVSPWDRHEPSYGDSPRYNEHFKNQLRELLTEYGPVSEVWFDGACGEGPNGKRQVYDWDGYRRLIRELQPGAVISIMGPDVRWIGNEAGVHRASEWSVIPVARMNDAPDPENPGGIAGLEAQSQDLGSLAAIEAVAKKGGRLIWYPAQVDVSIRPGWFYHAAEDDKVKTLDRLLDIYYDSVGGNAQLLLNIPPDKRGRIHENDVRRLKELGDALKATFSENLSAGATSLSMERRGGSGGHASASFATAGDRVEAGSGRSGGRDGAAFRTVNDRAAVSEIVYDLKGPRTFNMAMLRENLGAGQRIASFALDVCRGAQWAEIARGSTVGWKRLLRFPAVAAAKVRLRVLESRGAPSLAGFGLFLDQARAQAHPTISPLPEETPGLVTFVTDLGGRWKFAAEPPAGFWENGTDPSAWAEAEVPGEWAAQGYALGRDVERAYKRRIEVPRDFAGRRLILRFDGVYSYARVWVDGRFVRDHQGGFTSWECDVTGWVRPGEPSWLTVGVADMSDEISWGSNYAKHNIGGILQGVRLVALPAVHAERLHVETGLDASFRNGTLKVTAGLRLGIGESADVRLALTAPDGKPVRLDRAVIVLTASEPERAVSIPVGPVVTWEAEHPRLYSLEALVVTAGETVEVLRRDVGFRTVEVRGNALILNGRPVKLRGGCRHNVHPVRGRSVTADLDETDARLFRDANINFIRTSHYPPTEAFLAACDKYGLFVEEENAVCFVSTHGNLPTFDDPAYRGRYLDQFQEMIERDRSHPCIIMWSLGNESRWGANISQLYEYAKAEDPSRPLIWSYPDTVPKGTAGYDIYSYHYPAFDADLRSAAIPKLNDEWAHVACYNVETLRRDPGVRDSWGRSISEFWDNAYEAEGCLGGAIWGLVDDVFFLPAASCGYGEWGIIDGWRRPKPEYWHVKKAYSPVRLMDGPVAAPATGAPLSLAIQNRHDHTNLSEIVVTWEVGAESGRMPGPDVPPRGEGTLSVPVTDWRAGDIVRLAFARSDGLVLDEYALPVGQRSNPAPSGSGGPAPKLSEDESSISVSGPGFRFVVSKLTGLIDLAERGGHRAIAGGPFAAAAPGVFMPWSLTSLESSVKGNEAVIDVRGSYAGTLAAYLLKVDGGGGLTVVYDIKGRPEGAAETGIAFILPESASSLSWKRTGLHTVYPDDHIGRNEGTAIKLRPGPADAYRKAPGWPWAADMADYFLFGRDHAGCGATRDFRSLKAAIRRAEIGFGAGRPRLRVDSDGSNAVRAEVLPDGRVRLNILDHWFYPDLGWGNDGGAVRPPGEIKGTIRLRLEGD